MTPLIIGGVEESKTATNNRNLINPVRQRKRRGKPWEANHKLSLPIMVNLRRQGLCLSLAKVLVQSKFKISP